MFLATIGQVSVVNTFCHLHSPLLVSLQRTGWGILLGVGLGLLALGVLTRWTRVDTARPSADRQTAAQ
jgi:ABC-type nitrate/sulfonate/bicarbonate transport system permease component